MKTPTHILENNRQWRVRNRDKLRAKDRQDYLANREVILQKQKEYALRNPEKMRARKRKYYEENKAVLTAKITAYIKAHPEIQKKSLDNYKRKYPDRIKASKKKYSDAHKHENLMRAKARRARIRESNECVGKVSQFYRSVRSKRNVFCYYCGSIIAGKMAHIDHVIAVAKGGKHSVENLCTACPPCNQKKAAKLPSEVGHIDQKLLDL